MGDDHLRAEAVGARLKTLRRAYGLIQTEMAERCGVGRHDIANWESGRQRPSIEKAELIVTAFPVDMDWIFRGKTDHLRVDIARLLDETGGAG